jgi:hypothetical protein
MKLSHTEDVHLPAVKECLAKAEPGLQGKNDCEVNRFYKDQLCDLIGKAAERPAEQCKSDKKYFPKVIYRGLN